MKVPQLCVLSDTECHGTHYSFRSYINEQLRGLCRQRDISAVRVVSCDERQCVIEYHVEMPRDEI